MFFQRRQSKNNTNATDPSSYQPHDSFESSDCAQPARIKKICHLVQCRGKHGRRARQRAETARENGNTPVENK